MQANTLIFKQEFLITGAMVRYDVNYLHLPYVEFLSNILILMRENHVRANH